jgi:hypothetical protein
MAKKNAATVNDNNSANSVHQAGDEHLAGINEALREIDREREPLLKRSRRGRGDAKSWAINYKLMALNVGRRHLEDTRSWQQGERPSDSLDEGSLQVIQKAAVLIRAIEGEWDGDTSAFAQELKSFTEFRKCGISIPTNTLNIIHELTKAVLILKENEIAKKLADVRSEILETPPSRAEIDQVVEDMLRNATEAEDLP